MTKTAKPSLVFLCQVFYPDASSTSQLFRPLLAKLVENGYDVTVLSGRSGVHEEQRHGSIDGIKIRRHGVGLNHKRHLTLRSLAYATFLIDVFFSLLFMRNTNRFIGVTNPPFNIQMLALTSAIRKRQFDYICLDLHPEGLVRSGLLKNDSSVTRIWTWLNRVSYKRANKIYAIGRDMMSLLIDTYDLHENKISYVPHWSINEDAPYIEFSASKFTQSMQLQDKFVVQYSGNMGLWHDMETFVRAAKLLLDDDSVAFVFIGDGIRRQGAKLLADELGCTNIRWENFVDEEDLHESLSACHVALISLKEGLEGVAVPCKLYGILASGRVVLSVSPATSETALTVNEHGCGVNVLPRDVNGLASAIRDLAAKDSEVVRAMGLKGLEACRTHYSVANALSRLMV